MALLLLLSVAATITDSSGNGTHSAAPPPPRFPKEIMMWVVAEKNQTDDGWDAAATWLRSNRDVVTKVSAQTYFINTSAPSSLGVFDDANAFLVSLHTAPIGPRNSTNGVHTERGSAAIKTLPWVVPGHGVNSSEVLPLVERILDNPAPFLGALKADVAAKGHYGVNFDLEAWIGHNTSVAWPLQRRYAAFLRAACSELATVGAVVTADLGSTPSYGGNGMYTNISVFGGVPLAPGITMSTYQLHNNFSGHLADAVAAFGSHRAGIGLCDGCHNVNISDADIAAAFESIAAAGVVEVDWFALVTRGDAVVQAPTGTWLSHLRSFLAS